MITDINVDDSINIEIILYKLANKILFQFISQTDQTPVIVATNLSVHKRPGGFDVMNQMTHVEQYVTFLEWFGAD